MLDFSIFHYLCSLNKCGIKYIRSIIRSIIWAICTIYLVLIILLNIPSFQTFIGNRVAGSLEKKLGTKVRVGQIDIGLFNRIIINDALIADQTGKDMLSVNRLSAKIEWMPLFEGRISVTSAQVFGMKARLYCKDGKSKPNFAFLLDSLRSKDQTERSRLNLSINSLIVRHGRVRYDQWDREPTPGRFNVAHVGVQDLSGHFIIGKLTDDSLSLKIKRLSLQEQSGIVIRKLKVNVMASAATLSLDDLHLQTGHSDIRIPRLRLSTKDGHLFKSRKENVAGDFVVEPSVVKLVDFAPFLPRLRGSETPFFLSGEVNYRRSMLAVNRLVVQSPNKSLQIHADGRVKKIGGQPDISLHVRHLSATKSALREIMDVLRYSDKPVTNTVSKLGDVSFKGDLEYAAHAFDVSGEIMTAVGDARLHVVRRHDLLKGHVKTNGVNLRTLTDDDRFGMIALDMEAESRLDKRAKGLPFSRMTLKGVVGRVDFRNYSYANITVNGTYDNQFVKGKLAFDDPNGILDVEGEADLSRQSPMARIVATVSRFNPHALKLTDKWHATTFGFRIQTDVKGNNLNNLEGKIAVQDLTIRSEDELRRMNHFELFAGRMNGERVLTIDSDFGQADVRGQYSYRGLYESVINVVKKKLPSAAFLPKTSGKSATRYRIDADVNDVGLLTFLTGIDLDLQAPLTVKGQVDEAAEDVKLNIRLPEFVYHASPYRDLEIDLLTIGDTLHTEGTIKLMQQKGLMTAVGIASDIHDDRISSRLTFDNNNRKKHLSGEIVGNMRLSRDLLGVSGIELDFRPSRVFINDTVWNVAPSNLVYGKKGCVINHFTIGNKRQHITIDGTVGGGAADSLRVGLKEIDLNYVSDIINVKGVEFGGKASGTVDAAAVLSDDPQAEARLSIRNFKFSEGRLGDMSLKADWNKQSGKINILGVCSELMLSQMVVRGSIGLSPGTLDLNCDVHQTRVEFLTGYLGSVLKNVDARGEGHVRIFGPLDDINLEGDVVVNGQVGVKSTNVDYNLADTKVLLWRDNIRIKDGTFYDKRGKKGYISGLVQHRSLKDWSYDIDIMADNLLAYKEEDFGENPFCGTVYASGNCSIVGEDGETTIDIDATPQEGSMLKYNVNGPDAVKSQSFIRWNEEKDTVANVSAGTSSRPADEDDDASNIFLNFLVNTTPDLTLRLLMSDETGDYIDLHGNGILKASYFNKGTFTVFGNYVVSDGVYKMTIQNIIKKDFRFQEGGAILFGGDPYQANIALQARYLLNSVSLSGLNIGRSFSSNNIRVVCLMNIKGTPREPIIDFDLELPTLSGDVQQMIRSYINSEEKLNQQVIYLLTVGRFYAQDNNNAAWDEQGNASQTSLAMQSLLSGTLSQQLNTVLSNVINTSQWNFGTNISTGDEGWNNAEYEGILSGQLLDNRLQINGQFGYRDNPNATTSFIGDFDVRYLLFPNGNLAVKVYNQTNDRYFTRNSLNTQGVGLIIKRDFNNLKEIFGRRNRKAKVDTVRPEPVTGDRAGFD